MERNTDTSRLLARLRFLSNPKSKFDCWRGGQLDAARHLKLGRNYGMDSREKRIHIPDFIEELSLGISAAQYLVDHRAEDCVKYMGTR